jgi:hypothetical protein
MEMSLTLPSTLIQLAVMQMMFDDRQWFYLCDFYLQHVAEVFFRYK